MAIVRRVLRRLRDPGALRPYLRNLNASFSQYGEDRVFEVLLQPGSSGTYVDVGAHHPYDGSNTYGLYLKGWRGLTVDPNPAFAADYARWRPGDTHLVEGVAAEPCELTYHAYANSLYNTLSDARAAHLADRGMVATRRRVSARPLSAIVAEHLPGRQIDLLSVDCEGLDLEVIRSLDLAVHRPTAIIMEDFGRYAMFRDGSGNSALHDFLLGSDFAPVAQLAFSSIYVARDHLALIARSRAYDLGRIQDGILPSAVPPPPAPVPSTAGAPLIP